MLGTGLQLAYNILGGPSTEEWKDLYGTYGEQGPDREWYEGLKDPEIYQDAGRFSANTIKDILQFFPDMVADVGQAGISRLAQTELYNPLSQEGMERNTLIPGIDFPDLLEPEWKYQGDALLTDWLGEKLGTDVPTIMKDNPFENAGDNPIMDEINAKAQKETDDYFFEKNGFMTDKKWDDIYKKAAEQMPEYSEWAWDNPAADAEEYDEKFADIVSQEWDNRYADQWADHFEKSTKGQLLGKYNIGGKKTNPLREFEFGFDYASMGKPLFKYDPRRAETFEKAHRISEIAGGAGLFRPAIKTASRLAKKIRPSKSADEGIMRNAERLEDKRFDWAKRWMRDRSE